MLVQSMIMPHEIYLSTYFRVCEYLIVFSRLGYVLPYQRTIPLMSDL